MLLRTTAGLLVAVAALELAIVECFLLPLRIGGRIAPVSVVLALAGNVVLPRLAARCTGRRGWAAAPALVWIAVVLGAAVPRPEGDLIVTGAGVNVVFLIAGTLSGAYTVGRVIAGTRR